MFSLISGYDPTASSRDKAARGQRHIMTKEEKRRMWGFAPRVRVDFDRAAAYGKLRWLRDIDGEKRRAVFVCACGAERPADIRCVVRGIYTSCIACARVERNASVDASEPLRKHDGSEAMKNASVALRKHAPNDASKALRKHRVPRIPKSVREAMAFLGRLGGKARAANMSARKRLLAARAAAEARATSMSKRRRSEIARAAARARWSEAA